MHSCLRRYEKHNLNIDIAFKNKYIIPCADMTSLLHLLCSFCSGRCYVNADKLLLRRALIFELNINLLYVIDNFNDIQQRCEILIDVALAYYIAAIKNFNNLDDIKYVTTDVTAVAAANTASLGIESAVQVVGNVAAGAAISAIMDVAISSATIYMAKRKRDDGIISDKEFTTKIKKTVCKSSLKFVGGTTGSIIGQVFIPVPIVGALVGGLCGSLIGTGIGMGINYGVFDRNETKNEKKKENFISEHSGEKTLYKKLLLKQIPKTVVYKEREKQFEDKVFTRVLQEPTAESKPPKKEFLGIWRKKKKSSVEQDISEIDNEIKRITGSPTLILRRLRRNVVSKSEKSGSVLPTLKLDKPGESEECHTQQYFTSTVNGDGPVTPPKAHGSFLESIRKKSTSNRSHSDGEVTSINIDEHNAKTCLENSDGNDEKSIRSSANPLQRVKKFRSKFNEKTPTPTPTPTHDDENDMSTSTDNLNNSVSFKHQLASNGAVDTLPEKPVPVNRTFSLSSLKVSLRSLTFTSSETHTISKKVDSEALDPIQNGDPKQVTHNGNTKTPDTNENQMNEGSTNNDISSRFDINTFTDGDNQSDHLNTPTDKSAKNIELITVENAPNDIKMEDDSNPSVFQRINIQSLRKPFHSLSSSCDNIEIKNTDKHEEIDKVNNMFLNDRKMFRVEADNNSNNTLKQLHVTPCTTPNSQTELHKTDITEESLMERFSMKAMTKTEKTFFEKMKRSTSMGEERLKSDIYGLRCKNDVNGNLNVPHPFLNDVTNGTVPHRRRRIYSSPLIKTGEITEKIKNVFSEEKQKSKTKESETPTRNKRFSNFKSFFDSFGKKQ